MGGRTNLATIERQRNLKEERQRKAREEDAALERLRVETLTLAEMRGEVLDAPKAGRGERQKPMRRVAGLDHLKARGTIDDDLKAAGERYGAVYRLAMGEASIRSILNRDIQGGDGRDVMRAAERSAQARAKLEMYRRQLHGAYGLIGACDVVCGLEKTPREASKDGHEAATLTALLVVALTILCEASGTTSGGAA